MTDFLKIDPVTNQPKQTLAIAVSAGAGDAGRMVKVDAGGKIDPSLFPGTVGGRQEVIQASEALVAGDLVNIHDVTGRRVRKADASQSNASRLAHGFVLAAVGSGANATVFLGAEEITGLTGLTPGATLFLSATAGTFTTTAPTTVGHVVQQIGVATDTTSIQLSLATRYIN